jgi:diguanylate cyclase (GGDEF)-like protein
MRADFTGRRPMVPTASAGYPRALIREDAMPKGDIKRDRGSKTAPVARAPSGDRRMPAPLELPASRFARGEGELGLPRRTDAMRLAAEVERLELELAAARSRMAALEVRAEIDPLTEILNRRGFERELARALAHTKRYGTPAALLYLDLDGLKPVNDGHGHAAGDAVLRAVAAVLMRHVRESDVVARLGGDEFGVLLWHLSEADARRKALLLEAAIARTTAAHAGVVLAVGASVGAAVLLPLDRPADVLERADRAMYERKAARKVPAAAGA